MKRLKQIAIGVLVLITGLWLYDFFVSEPHIDDTPLQDDEYVRVDVADRVVQVTSHAGSSTKYVPSSGRSTVTVKDDGTIDVETKNKGLSLEAGMGVGYDAIPRATLDVQIGYWNRVGAHVGLGFGHGHPFVVPFVSASYRLDRLRLQNSSVFVGMTLRKEPIFGLRVEL